MPGAINNEDYTLIDVSKGVYVAHPVVVPDGHAYEMTNFVIRDGQINQRSTIQTISSDSVSLSSGWYAEFPINSVIYEVNLPVTLNNKLMLAAFVGYVASDPRPHLVAITTPGSNIKRVGKILPAATLIGSLAVYNGTLYAGATTGVIKIGVSNFPTSITETAIASSPTNLDKIIVHKSRLFGFSSNTVGATNRLYFTDAPTVGNLPETWNTTVNFIDFNGAQGFTRIYDIVSLNNYIYVFTDNGLFSLYTSGAPANWVVKSVNPDLSIFSQRQVIVRDNLIYVATEDGIRATDGFDFKLISQAISEYFVGAYQNDPASTHISAFDGGLLVRLRKPGGASTCFYTKLNNIAWTELNFCKETNSDNGPSSVEYITSIDLYDPSSFSGTTTYLVIHHLLYPNTTYRSFLYQYMTPNDSNASVGVDKFLLLTAATVTGSVSRSLTLTLGTKELMGSNFMRLKYFRDLILLFGSELPFTIAGKIWWNGQGYSTPLAIPMQDAPSDPIGVNHNELMQTLIKSGFSSQMAFSCRILLTLTMLQPDTIVKKPDRFLFSLLALGYTTELERTVPRAQIAGQF